MRNPTPFFAAFTQLLFGRPKRSAMADILAANKPVRSLSQLQEAYGEFIPQALLAPSKAQANSRRRIFDPTVTFWAFLAQVLERGSSCRDALLRIIAWWRMEGRNGELPSHSTSAYCQARSRLEEATLQQIDSHLATRLHRNMPQAQLWRGRRVKVADGTGISMPDSPANQRVWPQQKSQKPGCGFPLMKLVGIFCAGSGALLHTAINHWKVHDCILGRLLWKCLEKADILLADRGFCSYQDLHEISAMGADAVMRLHQARRADFRRGTRLAKDDSLVVWEKPAQRSKACTPEEFEKMPAKLTLRMLRFYIKIHGFRTKEVILVTTLLDAELYPLDALAELYFQRWSVELHFREIKTLLGMDILRCQTPAMIRKELIMQRIAYNLIRALMQRAAIRHNVVLARVSFKGTLDSLHHFANAIQACAGKPRKQAELLDELLFIIARDLLPFRPYRFEPRARKRRAKNYRLLTRPRREMRLNQHRNRWRTPHPKSGLS